METAYTILAVIAWIVILFNVGAGIEEWERTGRPGYLTGWLMAGLWYALYILNTDLIFR